MSDYKTFVSESKAQLDRLGDELSALESKVKTAGTNADDWSRSQLAKLKADWSKARANVDAMAQETRSEIDASWAQAKADAEGHWNALQAAVETYRAHVDATDATAKG